MNDPELSATAVAEPSTARLREGLLTLTVELPCSQRALWSCLTEPDKLVKWSPVVPDRVLDAEGPAQSQESPEAPVVDATVTDLRAPWYLEHRWGPDTVSWQLAPSGEGTQLNLVHALSDHSLAADMAAGWHLCLTVLRLQLQGHDVPRCVGPDALDNGWPQLREHYAATLVDRFAEQDEPQA